MSFLSCEIDGVNGEYCPCLRMMRFALIYLQAIGGSHSSLGVVSVIIY